MKDLAAWREVNGPDYDLWSYLGGAGTAELGVAFAALFWPEVVEVDGCVLLAARYAPANFATWMTHTGGDRPRVEHVLNHTHVRGLFPREDPPQELLEHLAGVLMQTWPAALRERFPDRTFTFHAVMDPDAEGPWVTFWQDGAL